jgi:mannosyltransferase
MVQDKTRTSLYIFALVGLNLLLKSFYLNANEIAGDEPFSIRVAQMPITDILSYLSIGNNPPLFELLLSVVVKTAGITLPWVRLISLLASSLTVVYIYLIGLRFSQRAALVSSLLFTFATFQFSFAHEARTYALFNLLSCASVFYFFLIKDKTRLHWSHFLFGVSCLLLIYSHYFGCVLLLIEFCWLVLFRRNQPQTMLLIVGVFVVCFVLFSPQLYFLYSRLGNNLSEQWLERPPLSALYINMMKMLNAPVTTVVCCILFLAATVLLLKKIKRVDLSSERLFILFWFVLGYGGLFLVSFFIPVFLDRYLVFLSAPLYLLIPLCIAFVFNQKTARFVHIGIVLLFVFSVNINPSNGRNWSPTIETIKQTKGPHTCVLIIPDWIQNNFSYHYDIAYFKDYQNTTSLLATSNCFAVNNLADIEKYRVNRFDTVIVFDGGSQFVDPQQRILSHLTSSFQILKTESQIKGLTIFYLKRIDNEN